MKIIIEESEIKEAIVAFVQSQVAIQEGQTIAVELKATRGETGNTAEITIASAVEEETVKPIIRRPRTKSVVPVTEDKEDAQEATESVPEPEPTDPAPEIEESPLNEPQAEDPLTVQQETSQTEDPSEQDEQATAPVKTGSLFASLQRPKNA